MTGRIPRLPAGLLLGILVSAACQTSPQAPQTAPKAAQSSPPATSVVQSPSPPGAAASPGAATSPAAAASPGRAASPAVSPVSPVASPAPAAAPKAAGPPAQLTVILDWYPWANHSGLYLAKQNGHFAAEGLDVKVEQPANPEDVPKIVARSSDTIGVNYETDVLLARGQDIPIQSIAAIVVQPLNSVMALQSSGITRPRDLAGKTVGFPGIPSNEAYLKAMLEKDGLKLSHARLVDVGFDLVPALIGGKVDAIIGAYWAHESILAELQGYPVNIIRVEEWGVPDYYELVFIANDDMVKNKPDVLRRFLRAVSQGYQDAAANPAAAVEAILRENPQARRDLETRSIQLLIPLWRDGSAPFGAQKAERWTVYADWLKEAKLLDPKTDPMKAFTNNLVPAS